jgi:hypothetical protein
VASLTGQRTGRSHGKFAKRQGNSWIIGTNCGKTCDNSWKHVGECLKRRNKMWRFTGTIPPISTWTKCGTSWLNKPDKMDINEGITSAK